MHQLHGLVQQPTTTTPAHQRQPLSCPTGVRWMPRIKPTMPIAMCAKPLVVVPATACAVAWVQRYGRPTTPQSPSPAHCRGNNQKDDAMIDALIAGRLFGQPTERTGKSGKPFAVAKVRCAAGDGESLFVSVIAFDAQPVAALLALGDGDSVAMSGSLTPKTWTDKEGNTRPGLDLVAHQVLSTYHVTRKRNAMQPVGQPAQPPQQQRQQQRPKDEAWRARAPQDRNRTANIESLDF